MTKIWQGHLKPFLSRHVGITRRWVRRVNTSKRNIVKASLTVHTSKVLEEQHSEFLLKYQPTDGYMSKQVRGKTIGEIMNEIHATPWYTGDSSTTKEKKS